MVRGINKVILIGNLGADPEIKYTAKGTAVCKFRLATTDQFRDREGNQQERTEWHRITTLGKLAEICNQYLSKGRQIYIEGSLRTSSWEDEDGKKHYMTEILARDVQFMGSVSASVSATNLSSDDSFVGETHVIGDDDVPF